jgi:mercuric reductase
MRTTSGYALTFPDTGGFTVPAEAFPRGAGGAGWIKGADPIVDYDLAIVGSGGAAFGAAIEARRRGARVVMIEEAVVGGTCVNVGCVPSKALLAAATARHVASSDRFAGVATSVGPVDLAALIGQKDALVAEMRQHKYIDLAEVHGFEVLSGYARFKDRTTLTVDGHDLSAGAYRSPPAANQPSPRCSGSPRPAS